jgi:hypothetical protein
MVLSMTRAISTLFRGVFLLGASVLPIAKAQDALRAPLEATYNRWQDAIVRRDVPTWQKVTLKARQLEIRNRLVSEKKPYPAAVFDLPAPPPKLTGLKFLQARQKGLTAKASYFGKIDFGIEGGAPTDNLLVLSFVQEEGAWKYDRADFINLTVLPAVRKELAEGDLSYLEETPDSQPSGVVPPTPLIVPPATTIAKVYVFCPGREVQVQVNKLSRHKFENAKEAEIVLGGVVDGLNEVQFTTKSLEGGTGKEAMTIRIYLMPEVEGVQPLKVFEYQIQPEGVPKSVDTMTFTLDKATTAKMKGR